MRRSVYFVLMMCFLHRDISKYITWCFTQTVQGHNLRLGLSLNYMNLYIINSFIVVVDVVVAVSMCVCVCVCVQDSV